MSISKNFPSIVPSLNLNFARSQDLDPRITFTRGSSATYVDDTGLIRTAGTNQARFDHDPVTLESLGLLIEESRTNLVLQSQSFIDRWDAANVSGNLDLIDITGTDNTTTSPDGTTNAATLSVTASGGRATSVISSGAGTTKNTDITFSCFLKANTSSTTEIHLSCQTSGSTFTYRSTANFTLSGDGSVSSVTNTGVDGSTPSGTASIQKYPNGWYRCIMSFKTYNGANVLNSTLPEIRPNAGSSSGSVYAWGRQVEAGAFPTSYIATTTATVTRSADSASITGTNFSGFYNNNEGSVIANFKFYENHPPYYDAVSVSGDGAGFMVNNVAGGLVTDCYGGGTVETGGDDTRTKFITAVRAYKFSTNDSVIGCSGANSITTQTGTIINQNSTALWLGRRGTGGSSYIMNGNIKQVLYYPVRLSNTQLLTFTKQS